MNDNSIIKKSTEEWLVEIKKAIESFGDISRADHSHLRSFAKQAPEMAALANGIDDIEIVEEMELHAWENLEVDLNNNGDLKSNFAIIFALAYLDGLAGGKLITEKSLERTMEAISPHL